jgi:hypothetical protein
MKPKAEITISSDDKKLNISVKFTPEFNNVDTDNNPACHFTALKIMELYAEHRGRKQAQ